MRRMTKLSIFLSVLIFASLSSGMVSANIAVQRTANFFADYTDYFNEPPNYVIYNNSFKDISFAYQLFAQYVSGYQNLSGSSIISIKAKNNKFQTTKECELETKDIILAAEKTYNYMQTNSEFPFAIKINECYISNSDFLYLLSFMIRDNYENGFYRETYLVERKYFYRIINWNSDMTNQRYILFNMDYESDRPVFSDSYLNNMPIVENARSIGVNPSFQKTLCEFGTCTIPQDYIINNSQYSSNEVAWYTAVKDDSGYILNDCYPFCGVLNGTPIILNDFVYRYGFPITLHMTGDSIIALATNEELLMQTKQAEQENLLAFGLHTMYHANSQKISSEHLNQSISDNYRIYQSLINITPLEFRLPYLVMPSEFSYTPFLPSAVNYDNEEFLSSICSNPEKCNYFFDSNQNMYLVKIDNNINKNDLLLNYYIVHPWEVIYETEGNPTYLKQTEDARINTFKKLMINIGKEGFVPVLPRQYLEMTQ